MNSNADTYAYLDTKTGWWAVVIEGLKIGQQFERREIAEEYIREVTLLDGMDTLKPGQQLLKG